MTLPQWNAFIDPVIRIMSDGVERSEREIGDAVFGRFDFTEEDLALTDTRGQATWRGRVHWAIYNSFRGGLLDKPGTGIYVISVMGKEAASGPAPITRETLRQNPSYMQWLKDSRMNRKKRAEAQTGEIAEVDSDDTPEESLIDAAERLNEALVDEIYDVLHTVTPRAFEELILKVVQAMGYGTEDSLHRTGGTGDKGIDGIIWQDALGFDRIYLQAKRFSAGNNVQSKDVRDFGGALMQKRAAKGIFITTSEFTEGAKEAARDISHNTYQIILIDGRRLARLMLDYRVGVQIRSTITTYRLDTEFFENLQQNEPTGTLGSGRSGGALI